MVPRQAAYLPLPPATGEGWDGGDVSNEKVLRRSDTSHRGLEWLFPHFPEANESAHHQRGAMAQQQIEMTRNSGDSKSAAISRPK